MLGQAGDDILAETQARAQPEVKLEAHPTLEPISAGDAKLLKQLEVCSEISDRIPTVFFCVAFVSSTCTSLVVHHRPTSVKCSHLIDLGPSKLDANVLCFSQTCSLDTGEEATTRSRVLSLLLSGCCSAKRVL
jgi:hypothetical protein